MSKRKDEHIETHLVKRNFGKGETFGHLKNYFYRTLEGARNRINEIVSGTFPAEYINNRVVSAKIQFQPEGSKIREWDKHKGRYTYTTVGQGGRYVVKVRGIKKYRDVQRLNLQPDDTLG